MTHCISRLFTVPLLFLPFLALASLSCDDADPVVAQVGEVAIVRSDYEHFVARLAPGTQGGVDDNLQAIVDQQLLLQEAGVRGIDHAAVDDKLRVLVRKHLAKRYQAEVLAPQMEVTQAEIERAFVEMGFDRERRLERILIRRREALESVLRSLREGTDFEQLIPTFAANDLHAPNADGVVGWIGREIAERYTIPLDVFLSLPIGQIAQPLQLAGGWMVFRFTADRKTELMDHAEEVASLLSTEKWQERLVMEGELLSRSFKLQLHGEVLRDLLRQEQVVEAGAIDEVITSKALYSFEGGGISLAEYMKDLQLLGFTGPLEDSLQVVELARTAILPAHMMAAEAKRREWHREDAFVEWRDRKRRALILQALIADETSALAGPTDEEVAAYYEVNKLRFRSAESARINQILLPTRQRALELLPALKEGKKVSEVLVEPGVQTHGDPSRDGEFVLRKIVRARYPHLVDAVFVAEIGTWSGPVEVLDSFAVFRVISREGGEVLPFTEVRSRARAVLTQRREEENIDTFINRLRKQNESRIELFVERLK